MVNAEHMKTSKQNYLSWQNLVAIVILIRVSLQYFMINEYGTFIDEFYYLACARRPAAGYVDHPPLSIWILAIVRFVAGESLLAIRSISIAAGAATIYASALLARELGGRTSAIVLTAIFIALVPVYLGMNKFYSMNSFDILFWAIGFWKIVRIIKNPNLNNWIILGLILGAGLLNKHSMLFFGFAFFMGMVFTQHRRWLLTPGPYLAAIIAFLIFLPNLIWLWQNDWPTLEFMRNAREMKNYFSYLHFLKGQILEVHPLFAPVWIGGLTGLLFSKKLGPFRLIGIFYLALLGLFLATEAKTYYLAAAYTVLFAAGSIAWDQLSTGYPLLSKLALSLLVAGGFALIPMSTPLLPPETYLSYQRFLGIAPPKMEKHAQGEMPQHFAGMFGWQDLQVAAKKAYNKLEEKEKEKAVFLARNYGFAGAIEQIAIKEKMAPVGSPHNSYFLWGPTLTKAGQQPEIIIAAGIPENRLRLYCATIQELASSSCKYCLPNRSEVKIFACRDLKQSLSEIWPRLKYYI